MVKKLAHRKHAKSQDMPAFPLVPLWLIVLPDDQHLRRRSCRRSTGGDRELTKRSHDVNENKGQQPLGSIKRKTELPDDAERRHRLT